MTIEWKLFFCPDGKFYETIADMPEVMLFDTDNYTVYQGEHIKFSVNRPDAEITLDGVEIPGVTRRLRRHTSIISPGAPVSTYFM